MKPSLGCNLQHSRESRWRVTGTQQVSNGPVVSSSIPPYIFIQLIHVFFFDYHLLIQPLFASNWVSTLYFHPHQLVSYFLHHQIMYSHCIFIRQPTTEKWRKHGAASDTVARFPRQSALQRRDQKQGTQTRLKPPAKPATKTEKTR